MEGHYILMNWKIYIIKISISPNTIKIRSKISQTLKLNIINQTSSKLKYALFERYHGAIEKANHTMGEIVLNISNKRHI